MWAVQWFESVFAIDIVSELEEHQINVICFQNHIFIAFICEMLF